MSCYTHEDETAHVHELLHTMQKNLHCAIAVRAESKSLKNRGQGIMPASHSIVCKNTVRSLVSYTNKTDCNCTALVLFMMCSSPCYLRGLVVHEIYTCESPLLVRCSELSARVQISCTLSSPALHA